MYFQPAPSYLAIPYLEAIAAKQGVDPRNATGLYHRCVVAHGPELDQPLPPNGHEPIQRFDLRRAITQMQLDRRAGDSSEPVKGVDEFSHAETASFVDAFVAPRLSHRVEVSHTID